MQSIPHPDNFCGGNFQDWLEVFLTEKCNGKCSWCIEKNGYHPPYRIDYPELIMTIIETGAKNVILLGGEPTLYDHTALRCIISVLKLRGINVYITTNGSKLNPHLVISTLYDIKGVNISIHHYDLKTNREITGISLDEDILRDSIKELHRVGASVRLNCNCIYKYIDNFSGCNEYLLFANRIGADSVRFAELKLDNDNFINLASIFSYEYGLSDDPFIHGCNKNAVIYGMPVNFRQMCGLQTPMRRRPINPKQYSKKVLYYDGRIYDGWQTTSSANRRLEHILDDIRNKTISIDEAANDILNCLPDERIKNIKV
jgi:hypothetical protein